jgi:hypothetical protein
VKNISLPGFSLTFSWQTCGVGAEASPPMLYNRY